MTAPQRHDCAVALCRDRKFFSFALFMVWQIAHHNPLRTFDFVISSQDDLEVPDWAKPYGIVMHKAGAVPVTMVMGRFGASVATLFRQMLARELGDRYRRILYLDCDMFVEGGDISRLLEVDLGPHPIAAVLDAPHFYVAQYQAKEFAASGLPAMPYLNSGLLLIDTRAYSDLDVERRAAAVVTTHPEALIYLDQSLINMALRGKFAQLAPCWNWQLNDRLPLVALRYPVFLNHFIGSKKPDRGSSGLHGARFNNSYREFMTNFIPDMLPGVAAPCDPVAMTFKMAASLVMGHVMSAGLVGEVPARHPDPYLALV